MECELISKSEIFTPMILEVEGFEVDCNLKRHANEGFHLADYEAFHGVCSVIPDRSGESNACFQVKPRREWVADFKDWSKKPDNKDEIDMNLLKIMREAHKEKEREKQKRKKSPPNCSKRLRNWRERPQKCRNE